MKAKNLRRTLCAVTVLLLAAGFMVPAAEAGVKKIWAADFKPVYTNQDTGQLYVLENMAGYEGGRFFAKVKIPAGTVVTKVEAEMRSSVGTSPAVAVYIERARLDGSVWEETAVLLNGSSSGAWTVNSATSFENPGYVNKAKDRWFAYVYLQDDTCELRWVKIYYQAP